MRPGRTHTLRAGLRVVLTIAVLLVAAGAAVSFVAFGRLDDDTTELIDGVSPARVQAANLTAAYLDQETGVRGFALSHDESFLAPYADGVAHAAEADRAIRGYLPTPQVTASLDRIAAAGVAWRRDYAEKAIARIRATPAGTTPKLKENIGKVRFDALRAQVTALNDAIAAERASARDRVHSGLRNLLTLTSLAFGGVLVAGLLIWWALRRLVLGPLDRLAAETRAVAAGDFGRRVIVTGPAEIRELTDDVEAMRKQIAEALTEALAAEREIRTQAELLTRQADELELQAVDLRRSNDELEQFAYVASHDLQEPLRKVASFCQILQRRYGGQLDERADQYIEFAVDGAKRMQQLINDLLAFSRVGRTTDRMEPVDTGVIAAHAIDALAETVAETGARVEVGDLPIVHGDDALLTQVFQNLIGNAIKFRAPDRPPVVTIAAEREDEFWHFRCEDNGIGVDPEYADRIFVIFQRLHSKDQFSGTGIGLSLCKKIVEYHGGRIWLDTDRNGAAGSVVHWTLPVEPAPNLRDLEATSPLRKVSS